MNSYPNQRLIRGLATLVGGVALFTGTAHAAPFLYVPGDLILAFRQTGNASDYVVNIGKASEYSILPPGTQITVSNLSVDQLKSAFPSLNGLRWSVAAANRPPLVDGFPIQTLWVTAPRIDSATQSNPYLRKSQSVQGNTASQVDGVGVNAALSSNLIPGGPGNTATGVVLPVNAPFPIGPVLGVDGDYAGTFQGSVENVTPDDFDSDATNISRSDLYEILPGSRSSATLDTPARVLGYFELNPDGKLIFQSGSPVTPRPTISGISRTGETTSISFNSVAGIRYQLRYTDAPGLSSEVSTWLAVGSVVGNGSSVTLEDTHGGPARFYIVEVKP